MVNKKRGGKSIDHNKVMVIVNPVSGGGVKSSRLKEVKSILKTLHYTGHLAQTTPQKNASYLAERAIKQGIEHIIVCGGDGTIMEVVQTVINHPKISIGIVALGTGNLFAKNLNLYSDLPKMFHVALHGKTTKIDVGVANDTYFVVMAGIGIDASIMNDATPQIKKKLGFVAYIWASVKNIKKVPGRYKVVIDNKKTKIYVAKTIITANMGKIQGGIEVVPGAGPTTHELAMGVVKANNFVAWGDIFLNIIRGNVNRSDHYEMLKGKEFVIECQNGPKPYQCDGNHFDPVDTLKITLLPNALKVKI